MPLKQIGALSTQLAQHASIEAYREQTTREHERAIALLEGLATGLSDKEPPEALATAQCRVAEPWAFVSRALRTTRPTSLRTSSEPLPHSRNVQERISTLVAHHGEVSW